MMALGIDPGFAHLGWAVVDLRSEQPRLMTLGVIVTKKDPRKVLATVDLHRRGQEIARELRDVIAAYPSITIACAESISFVRSASSMAAIGRAWGVVDAVLDARSIGLVQASPQELKEVLCGSKTASKDDVLEAVVRRCGERVREQLRPIARSRWEHPVDAVGAVLACMERPEMRIARGVARQRSLEEMRP